MTIMIHSVTVMIPLDTHYGVARSQWLKESSAYLAQRLLKGESMVYLDAAATTELLPGALDAMLPFLGTMFGNPSSRHPGGVEVRVAVEHARSIVAGYLWARSGEIVFTASGTESVNLAFQCALARNDLPIVVSAAEHSCVLDAAEAWRGRGRRVVALPIGASGYPEPEALERVLANLGPSFVSLIWVNNETGIISPVADLTQVCTQHGALLHLDAVQAATHLAVDVGHVDCHFLSFSAHKFHGPKGCGILFLRSSAPRSAQIPGHQEAGLRGGTENVPAIVGTGEALAAQSSMADQLDRCANLRDAFEHGVLKAIPGAAVNGAAGPRTATISNIHFPGCDAAEMVAALGRCGVWASAGAACSNGGSPSHVLLAMGLGPRVANESVRFSFSPRTSIDDMNEVVTAVARAQSMVSLLGRFA